MRLSLWPRSLFGRLIAASIVALLLAQVVSLILIARERERFILQGSVREWSRRIAEVTSMLQGMDASERTFVAERLSESPWRFGRRPPDVVLFRDGLLPEPDHVGGGHSPDGPRGPPGGHAFVPFTKAGDLEATFEQQLRSTLGAGFDVNVVPTPVPARKAISISGPLFSESHEVGTEQYDASVRFPDGYVALFRVTRLARGAPLPRGLFMNVALLVIVMSVALFVTARGITRPLSELASAADNVGRNLRQPKLAERGALEVRHAARAFNTMQDRLQRYLDSRSRVLAAMSHDLKTPLTRLRLQVEMLDDPSAQARIGRQLDEMESMVHGALALFRGLDDNEGFTPIDLNEVLATLQSEFTEMNSTVRVDGRAAAPVLAKPQALRRCLTNLIANAVKFGTRAWIVVEDGPALIIRVRDDGPGIPEEELERVFEPFHRVESSRNRDTGGSGLGLGIARDVVQAHGGTLTLRNLPVRGLEATITLPRA
jgi:signal transduction histidine kinase